MRWVWIRSSLESPEALPSGRASGLFCSIMNAATISGSGVFKDATTDERVRQIFFDGQVPGFQVIIPG